MMKSDSWFIEVFDGGKVGGLSFQVDEVLFQGRSPYQHIEVVQNSFLGKVMLLDGLVMLTEKDEFYYHDMLVHVPMACVEDPENVLVVGGGDGGSVREMLKHPSVRRVVLCEIDGMVIEAARRFFPSVSSCLDDSRVEVVVADGIDYVSGLRNEFDCICIDSTDPVGPAAGLFSTEFYTHVRDALTEKGAMSAQSESPAWSMEEVTSIVRNMKNAFGSVHPYIFPIPCYPSGLWSCTVCFRRDRNPVRDFDRQRAALLAKACKYYNADIHTSCFALPNFFRQAL
jgi:spermidine synthase